MAFTDAQLTAIEDAISKGELTVQFADRSVTYRSIKDLILARELILTQRNTASRQFLGVPTSKGF